jgi:hypothetical protein
MIQSRNIFKHQLCYDGLQDGFYEYQIDFEGIDLLKVTDYATLFKLKESLDASSFESILKDVNALVIDRCTFNTSDNLSLAFAILERGNKKFLTIISRGEFQPGRYKIFKEGIWELG